MTSLRIFQPKNASYAAPSEESRFATLRQILVVKAGPPRSLLGINVGLKYLGTIEQYVVGQHAEGVFNPLLAAAVAGVMHIIGNPTRLCHGQRVRSFHIGVDAYPRFW